MLVLRLRGRGVGVVHHVVHLVHCRWREQDPTRTLNSFGGIRLRASERERRAVPSLPIRSGHAPPAGWAASSEQQASVPWPRCSDSDYQPRARTADCSRSGRLQQGGDMHPSNFPRPLVVAFAPCSLSRAIPPFSCCDYPSSSASSSRADVFSVFRDGGLGRKRPGRGKAGQGQVVAGNPRTKAPDKEWAVRSCRLQVPRSRSRSTRTGRWCSGHRLYQVRPGQVVSCSKDVGTSRLRSLLLAPSWSGLGHAMDGGVKSPLLIWNPGPGSGIGSARAGQGQGKASVVGVGFESVGVGGAVKVLAGACCSTAEVDWPGGGGLVIGRQAPPHPLARFLLD